MGSRNESNQEPRDCRLHPRPHSVGQGSIANTSCGAGPRLCPDLALPWLWRRPETAALIQTLAWEPPYAMEVALEKAKRQKKKRMCLVF